MIVVSSYRYQSLRSGEHPRVIPLLLVRFSEAIAYAIHHLDVPWAVWVVFDLAAQVLDMRVDRAVIALEAVIVHALDQLGAGERPAWVPRQHGQQVELRSGKLHRRAAA